MIFVIGSVGTTFAFGAFLLGAGINPASRLALTGYSVPSLPWPWPWCFSVKSSLCRSSAERS